MLYIVALIVGAVLIGLLCLQVYRIVRGYRAGTGTPWQKFLGAFHDSATIFTARLGAFVSAAIAFGINFLPALDPGTTIGAALAGVMKPEYAPWYALAFAVIVEIVRRRPGSVDPILPAPQSKV